MAEPVALAHADNRHLGTKHLQRPRRNRLGAPVVTDLQHVDIAESPVARQRLEHVLLGVTGEDCRETLGLHAKHDAGLIGRGVIDRGARPHCRQREAPRVQNVACSQFVDGGLAHELNGLRLRGRDLLGGSRGEADHLCGDETVEGFEPSGMIGVQVGDDHSVKRADTGPAQRAPHRRLAGPGVNQHRARSVAHQNRVSLADVENFDPSASGD
jgi:hypothetical protein